MSHFVSVRNPLPFDKGIHVLDRHASVSDGVIFSGLIPKSLDVILNDRYHVSNISLFKVEYIKNEDLKLEPKHRLSELRLHQL